MLGAAASAFYLEKIFTTGWDKIYQELKPVWFMLVNWRDYSKYFLRTLAQVLNTHFCEAYGMV